MYLRRNDDRRGNQRRAQNITVKTRSSEIDIPLGEVLYIQNELRKVVIHTIKTEFREYSTMDIVLSLTDDRIFRVHYSLAINLDKVIGIDLAGILLDNGEILTMGRAALQKSRKRWHEYRS